MTSQALDQELAEIERVIAATERWQKSQDQNERIQRMCRKALAGLQDKRAELHARLAAAKEVARRG